MQVAELFSIYAKRTKGKKQLAKCKEAAEYLVYTEMLELSHKSFYKLCVYSAQTERPDRPSTIELWMMKYLGASEEILNPELVMKMGRFLFSTGAFTHALLCCKYALGRNGKSTAAQTLYDEIMELRAENLSKNNCTKIPHKLTGLSFSAYTNYEFFQYEEALVKYRMLLNAVPNHEKINNCRNHVVTLLIGNVDELLEITRYAIEAVQNYRAALHFVKKAVEINPKNLKARTLYQSVLDHIQSKKGCGYSEFIV